MDDEATQADARFARNLRTARERLGLSQGDLARLMKEAGFPSLRQQAIARIEHGSRKVGLGEATALARSVGTYTDALTRPWGLAREAWQITDAARDLRTAHAEITRQARRFRAARAALEHALRKAEREGHAADLADEVSAGRRALELSLDDAITEES